MRSLRDPEWEAAHEELEGLPCCAAECCASALSVTLCQAAAEWHLCSGNWTEGWQKN